MQKDSQGYEGSLVLHKYSVVKSEYLAFQKYILV